MQFHLHIVGCAPRSGTTLLAEMCKACFDIDSACEHEQSVFKRMANAGRILLTKSPREGMYMPFLLPLDRHLWCLYVMRDPRDVIVSEHKDAPGSYYVSLWFWKKNFAIWRRLRRAKRCISVRYEDLVIRPDEVQQELVRQMPFLKPKFLFSEYHLVGNVSEASRRAMHSVRAVDTSSIGRWKQHLPRVKSQLLTYGDVDAELLELGYEQDGAWKTRLENVEAGHNHSVMDERLSPGQRMRLSWRIVRKTFWYALGR